MVFQSMPLPVENPLDEFLKLDLIPQFLFRRGDRIRLAKAQACRPLLPGYAMLIFSDGQKERIVVEPVGIQSAEATEIGAVAFGSA